MSSRGRVLLAVAASLLPVAGSLAAGPVGIGQPVPGFEVTSLQGGAFSLKSAIRAHKAVVVLFTSTVCPYANLFSGHVREMSETYGPRGVLFVAVNSNKWESKEEVTEHARAHGFRFPMIKDEGHVIADRLGASRTPEAFVVDAEGKLRYRGRVKSKQESPDLQHALDAVLEGRPVRLPVTKAFGCALDRS
jgi:peroxiredoxin